MIDDHYYKQAEDFFADVHHYDKADRSGRRYLLESGRLVKVDQPPTSVRRSEMPHG